MRDDQHRMRVDKLAFDQLRLTVAKQATTILQLANVVVDIYAEMDNEARNRVRPSVEDLIKKLQDLVKSDAG